MAAEQLLHALHSQLDPRLPEEHRPLRAFPETAAYARDWVEADIGVPRLVCEGPWMNMFFAFAFGGVLLILVGRSTIKAWTLGFREMIVSDKRVAIAIVGAALVAFVATVLVLHYSQS